MAQSLKIPRANKFGFADVAKHLDEAKNTSDPTLSTAGKTIENSSTSYYRTANTNLRNSV